MIRTSLSVKIKHLLYFVFLIIFIKHSHTLDSGFAGIPYVRIPLSIKTVLDLPVIDDCEPDLSKIKKKEIDGFVIVYIQVSESGYVENSAILKCSCEFIRKPVLDAVKKMKFQKFIDNGVPRKAQFMKLFCYQNKKNQIDCVKNEVVFGNLRLPNIVKSVIPKCPNDVILDKSGYSMEISVEHDIYGKVIDTKVIKGNNLILNEQVRIAIEKWVHDPLIISGNPLNMRYKVEIIFKSKSDINADIFYHLDYDEAENSLKSVLELIKKPKCDAKKVTCKKNPF
ncbi:MAG: energy transducer TonB [Candidatus Aminicenantes bacterium]|nr:energy transducer TonB [Candidatus Aminicenantes bacterium]